MDADLLHAQGDAVGHDTEDIPRHASTSVSAPMPVLAALAILGASMCRSKSPRISRVDGITRASNDAASRRTGETMGGNGKFCGDGTLG